MTRIVHAGFGRLHGPHTARPGRWGHPACCWRSTTRIPEDLAPLRVLQAAGVASQLSSILWWQGSDHQPHHGPAGPMLPAMRKAVEI
jgi:hypothetical protein